MALLSFMFQVFQTVVSRISVVVFYSFSVSQYVKLVLNDTFIFS